MSDWTSGYVADVDYTYGYYPELNPLRARLPFLRAGLAVPEFDTACELGFGQGLSIGVHAAASSTRWAGTDFNPSQAGFAQELMRQSGAGAQICDEAFAEFCNRQDLPDFDFIGLHGIWSWISDENRRVIVDFIRRKLKVGGVVYVSYNTLPGWGAFAPMRHLMTEHAQVLGASGHGIVERINGSLAFVDKLMSTNPAFARANPQIAERLNKLKDMNRHYLAHEYFNRDWHPMHFATMGEWLKDAKLTYACSATPTDHVDALNLTAEQQAILAGIPDPMFRESVRDFIVNQQFRRDYWIKGARTLNVLEQSEAIRNERVMLITNKVDIKLKVTGAQGEASMSEGVYVPILDVLADHRPRTLGEVERLVAPAGVNLGQILQAALVLTGQNHLAAVQSDHVSAKARARVSKLNAFLAAKSRNSGDISVVASPLTGGGISIPRFTLMSLYAYLLGKRQADEIAAVLWQILSAQNQKVVKEGKQLDTSEENISELSDLAKTFLDRQLPILKALQVV